MRFPVDTAFVGNVVLVSGAVIVMQVQRDELASQIKHKLTQQQI